MTAQRVPTTASAIGTLARVTVQRLLRGKALWVGAVISLFPLAIATILGAQRGRGDASDVFVIELLLLGILPPMFLAATVGEELEERTATYLWSRPIARWSVLAGKLVALAPIVVALCAGSWYAAIHAGFQHDPPIQSVLGLAAGALAVSLIATGIGALAPRHGLALAIMYVLFLDYPIGELPAALQYVSVTHQTKVLAGMADGSAATAAIALAALGAGWLALGLRRIRRLEV